ncbi:MAG TPA: hypothetical protein VNV37_12800 [Solirubrobacteraceae bacterium]|nr:hypothetical protein [Solirubrobacteraceae bacterium]
MVANLAIGVAALQAPENVSDPPGSERWPLRIRQFTKETTRMTRIKLAGLCLVAMFAFGVVAVAQASAAEYAYHVKGKKLEEKEARTIEASMKSKEFVLRGKGLFNAEAVTKCTSLTSGGQIEGGIPGTSAKELIEFKGCSATIAGFPCKGVKVSNVETINEIVTVKKAAKAALIGRLAVLFKPAKGEGVFSKVEFEKCGLAGSPKAEIKGKIAALVEKEKVEAVTGVLQYQTGESEITEAENSKKEPITLGLANEEGKKATLEGEADVSLTSKEEYGVF